ncbi:sugar-transfer associated ATP-grasp domain-containing protein [Winogradskyella sp. MIT101101]|uniref:sugar-transfer associated ATP-grasp domain-containing protein n=1 Tax=Winogradskyella sp. MIT101101 TaxID=3098297 RepID=UPI003999AC53
MSLYQRFKNSYIKRIPTIQQRLTQLQLEISARRYMKSLMAKRNLPKLSAKEIKEAKSYYKARGYKLKNTYWHRYYKGINGEFHKNYVPYDIFNPKINPRLNQSRQWPALLDKNLTYNLFREFNQPKRIVQNVNGFYYINDEIVGLQDAINACGSIEGKLIIKPTIDSGRGKMVNTFSVLNSKTTYKDYSIEKLFRLYGKDFVIQECLEQSAVLKSLNPSSLNTLRIVSYLNNEGVHILSSVLRVGKLGSSTDNFSTGGLFCGILHDGTLKGKGYNPKGEVVTETSTGISIADCKIPNYAKVQEMVKSMHHVVPYFRIIAWDIGINKDDLPYLIEYNTYKLGIDLQIADGPLLGDFTDEILALALQNS